MAHNTLDRREKNKQKKGRKKQTKQYMIRKPQVGKSPCWAAEEVGFSLVVFFALTFLLQYETDSMTSLCKFNDKSLQNARIIL